MQRVISHEELDGTLEALDVSNDRFDEALLSVVKKLDAEGRDLEVSDPASWRKPASRKTRCSFSSQFRADVSSILALDRDEELRLAKRIQFARLRLERTADAEGLGLEERERLLFATQHPQDVLQQRALELQRLRIEMVERNLYLVLINAERYARRGGSREDLIQEACIALFRAVDRFDWKRGLLFRTYAVHWLNQAFRTYLYNQSHTVRVPVYLQKALKHINQATIRLGKEYATPEEIAASSELSPSLVRTALAAARGSYSLDAFGDSKESAKIIDSIVDEGAQWGYRAEMEVVSLPEGLRQALDELPERDRNVIERRFAIGHERESTLAELAAMYGISLERVRQIQARALCKMDTPRLRHEMDPFLN